MPDGETTPLVKLAKALVVTAEIMGHELSPLAAESMARDLADYPAHDVAQALKRCRRELTGRLTLAAILQRIDDGHPGPEEAWALCPRSEAETAVWTDQVSEAYFAALPLLEQGDSVAARMAFLETYREKLRRAREDRVSARWTVSAGFDKAGREAAVLAGVEAGKLDPDYALRIVGSGSEAGERVLKLVGREPKRLPAGERVPPEELRALLAGLTGSMEPGE